MLVKFSTGGIYESDDFYDLADEFGILLWHDFMFACSMYQANDDFLLNVREEITHQVGASPD
jgi:beta-mannosidase